MNRYLTSLLAASAVWLLALVFIGLAAIASAQTNSTVHGLNVVADGEGNFIRFMDDAGNLLLQIEVNKNDPTCVAILGNPDFYATSPSMQPLDTYEAFADPSILDDKSKRTLGLNLDGTITALQFICHATGWQFEPLKILDETGAPWLTFRAYRTGQGVSGDPKFKNPITALPATNDKQLVTLGQVKQLIAASKAR